MHLPLPSQSLQCHQTYDGSIQQIVHTPVNKTFAFEPVLKWMCTAFFLLASQINHCVWERVCLCASWCMYTRRRKVNWKKGGKLNSTNQPILQFLHIPVARSLCAHNEKRKQQWRLLLPYCFYNDNDVNIYMHMMQPYNGNRITNHTVALAFILMLSVDGLCIWGLGKIPLCIFAASHTHCNMYMQHQV